MPSGARGPFETVESVVHAVSSISMLLEQTYSALISSVRSVYAVGEQVSRMKNQMVPSMSFYPDFVQIF